MRDLVVVGALVLAFATLATTHLALVYGLARLSPRWRAAGALLVLPLAPYWGWREGMRVRAGLWAGALLLYALGTALAR
jgi:hypothetical protein